MELNMREVNRNRKGKTIVHQFVIDDDYNVPDSKRDMQSIIASSGNIRLEEMKPSGNYLKVSGKVEFQILYVGEGAEPVLSSMDGKVPFEEMIYIEDTEAYYELKQMRVEFYTEMIHSRKLRLKAMVELEVDSEMTVTEEIPVDVESSMELFKKVQPLEMLQLHTSKRDMYRIKEEIILPGTKETIGNLLWTDISSRRLDTKLGTDELLISGELQVFFFYESPEGKLDWLEQMVPYEGRISCGDVHEQMYHHVNANLEEVHADARLDEDGEMRVIGIDGTLRISLSVYTEELVEVLEDVYSLKKECRLQKKEGCYERLILQNHSKCKVTERLSIPELRNMMLQICHSSGTVQVDQIKVVDEGVLVEGAFHVKFLYVKASDDTPFGTWQGVVPFSYLIECKGATEDMLIQITSAMEQLSVSLLGGEEVEVKGILAFHCFFKEEIPKSWIRELKMEDLNMELLKDRPGVVGYIVKEGDDLWSLAKRFYTTVEGIKEVNEMNDDTLKKGERILIFKESMSIL